MRRLAVLFACAAAALAACPAGGRAATAQQAISELDAQRAVNGIPAGITEAPAWSADCAEHDHYMAVNHKLTPFEKPGSQGYTKGGAFAGRNSVLIEAGSWDSGNPYESAPLHLDQLLAPRLQTVGSADAEGFSCTTTFPGWTRPDPPAWTLYTYPGDGASIYASEAAHESPWTPAQLAGIPGTKRTGPNLIVFADAPGQSAKKNPARLSGATLTGPTGPVQIKTVDGETSVPSGRYATLYPYISPGGFIIPVKPLVAGVTYHAHVVVTFAGAQAAHDWTFTTTGADPQSSLRFVAGVIRFASTSREPVHVTFTRSTGAHAPAITIAPGHHVRVRLVPGSWQACGHQRATATFTAYDRCIPILVTGVPSIHLGMPRVIGGDVVVPLRFSAVLRGRIATLTITALTVHCHNSTCASSRGPVSRHTIILEGKALHLMLPARGHGLQLALSTAPFQLGDAPWTAAHATSRPFLRS